MKKIRTLVAWAMAPVLLGSSLFLHEAQAGGAQDTTPLKVWKVEDVTGASHDESSIKVVLTVDQQAETSKTSFKDLNQALWRAKSIMKDGTAVKVVVKPGVYRKISSVNKWERTAAKDALLVIEGTEPGSVVLSGADVYPADRWTDHGHGLYSCEWKHDFGHYSLPWMGNETIGHRREMVFVNGQLMQQTLLEDYDFKKSNQDDMFNGGEMSWDYKGFLDPAKTLKPGQFGVAERDENGNKMYVRLPEGLSLADVEIEISTKPVFMDFRNKNNLVLRNLTVTGFASSLVLQGSVTGIRMGHNRNVLVDTCQFVWNNGHGFRPSEGSDFTIKNSAFNYNGYSGLQLGGIDNLVLENCVTNFNNWRGSWGDIYSWFIGGAKLHRGNGHRVTKHQAFGNMAVGFWYDIHLHHIFIEDLVSAYNHGQSVFIELSGGPFDINRSIIGPSLTNMSFMSSIVGDFVLRNSIVYSNDFGGHGFGKIDKATGQSMSSAGAVKLQWYLRRDSHARMRKVLPKMHTLENTIVYSNKKSMFALYELNGSNRASEEYKLYRYGGKNNLFFSETAEQGFSFHDAGNRKQTAGLEGWAKHRPEVGSAWEKPDFVDPDHLDFRLKGQQDHIKQRFPETPFVDLSVMSKEKLEAFKTFAKFARFELKL